MDFGALPPEINSGLMYAGPGSGPMLAAATAWEGLAAELRTAATGYGEAVAELADAGWQGPSATAMATAAAPYVDWMHSTAAQAEQAGMQASAAAAAHEAAFAATVPPAVIAANRSLLASLAASNVMGINTPAIMTTEAHYAEMWAQDAAAMYAYAGSSAAASALSPMAIAPVTTNAAGLVGSAVAGLQGAVQNAAAQAVSAVSALPSALNSSASTLFGSVQSGLSNFAGLLGMPLSQGAGMATSGMGGTQAPGVVTPMRAPMETPRPATPAPAPRTLPATPVRPEMHPRTIPAVEPRQAPVRAGMGQATPVGGLSAPSSWGTAATAGPAAADSGALSSAAAPAAASTMARGIPAGQVSGMEVRAYSAPELPRMTVLQRSVAG
ncbi:PPE family protein [Mycobacterium szulgai]|uniref:PPE family domain-containing protein n=1 Tax=Mycobacterium szulgai TaxID=1787 RepID=A0A1X2DXI3_MYCSZ|nr:PPE family protein [Mycobacterium szulgai]MCV7075245.1 PPE family protein [Mycobacterium szulgai]ORW92790.1 hypothetical protein AWC27_08675 [Mycobacterium szulgai]